MPCQHCQCNHCVADRQVMDAEQAWPGFAEHMDAITKALVEANQNGEPLSLWEAFERAVPGVALGS